MANTTPKKGDDLDAASQTCPTEGTFIHSCDQEAELPELQELTHVP